MRAILLFGLVILALIGVAWFEAQRTPAEPVLLPSKAPSFPGTLDPEVSPASPSPTPSPLRVYISGAVASADVYQLPPGSIVKDALLAAGGAAADADLDRINLAAQVTDGQHVYVPHAGEAVPVVAPPGQPVPGSTAGGAAGRLNINTATAEELETLPGIGPSLAARIVAHREARGPFSVPEDITQVSGIGPATFEKIRELITTN
jgi:competence protein ComEA